MSLKTLLEEKKDILSKIDYYKDILNKNILEHLNADLLRLNRQKEYYNDKICSSQDLLNSGTYLTNQQMNIFFDNEESYNKANKDLVFTEEKIQRFSDLGINDFDDVKSKINSLESDLESLITDISNAREEERLAYINNNSDTTNGSDNEEGDDVGDIDNKVWIDENLGIYIIIDKPSVISAVMKQVFKGGEIPDTLLKKYANPEVGGIAALLEAFIGILIKAIGSFAKQFFFLKNTIDLLVGLQLGELLGNAIPGLIKILKEIKLLFSDPAKFIMNTLMGPLFDANFPIPKFCLNIGDFIPFLPFEMCVPEIDPYGYLSKITPMNINADQRKVDSNWIEDIQEEIKALKLEEVNNAKTERKEKNDELDKKILDSQNLLSAINKYIPKVTQCEIGLLKLQNREEECKVKGCDSTHFKSICDGIISQKQCLSELESLKINEDIKIEELLNDENIRNLEEEKLTKLLEDKQSLQKTPITTKIEYKKKAILVAYEQHIDTKELDVKLSRIHEIGVNIYDPNNLEILQKLGHDYSNDNYISRLEEIKSYGISLSNTKQLRILYELGFNFNDITHKQKISNLRNFVSLESVNLRILVEMGLNIHNSDVFEVLTTLKNMNIDILNVDILVRLQTIGFNFNSPYSIPRLEVLGEYIDLSNISAYSTALKRNINLNNPYFIDILEKTFKIGLVWGDSDENGFFDVEEEIKNNTSIPSTVSNIKNILDIFLMNENHIYTNFIYNNNPNYNILWNLNIHEGSTIFENAYQNYISYDNNGNVFYQNKIYFYEYYRNLTTTYTIITDGDYDDERLEVRTNIISSLYNRTYSSSKLIQSVDSEYHILPTPHYKTEINIEVLFGQALELFWKKPTTNNTSKSFTVSVDGNMIFESGDLKSLQTGLTNLYFEDEASIISKVSPFVVKAFTLSHFKNYLNTFNKYGIIPYKFSLDSNNVDENTQLASLNEIKPYGHQNYFFNSDGNVYIDEYYIEQLDLLTEFHINQGWVVQQNGEDVHVDANIGGYVVDNNFNGVNDDFSDISGLHTVVLENPSEGEISYDVLKAVVGNFDQLGLNIRDENFKTKFDMLFDKFGITIDTSVILDTTREVILTYIDVDTWEGDITNLHHPIVSINLNEGKADPKVFEDEKYDAIITVTEKRIENVTEQPTKTVAQFDILQKLGFNYQIPEYESFLNKLKGIELNLKKMESKLISESLISLGWHWSNDRNFTILNNFISLGFTFNIIENRTPDNVDDNGNLTNNYYSNIRPQMYGKLEHLNTIGFNFNKPNYNEIISKLKAIGLLLSNDNFEKVIEKFIALGINFNDIDWNQKLQVFIDNGISFGDDSPWENQLNNLIFLGISFLGDDWNKHYNKMMSMKTLGLDFTQSELNKKISILTKLGIDFSKPEDEWKEKINSLVLLKLINISNSSQENKNEYSINRNEKIRELNKSIDKYEKLNSNPSALIDEKIKELSIQYKILQSKENGSEEICNLQDELNGLLTSKKSIEKTSPSYDEEINNLKGELNVLRDESYKLNEDLVFGDLDKFKALDESGLNFYNDDYKKNTKILLDNGFNFDKPDWYDRLKSIGDLIPGIPILDWIKVLTDIVKTIIMMPMMMLMGLIKKLVDMITAVIEIPLNPLEIPSWAKNIVKKFAELIKMIMTLPTLDGMMDFLFMSVEGLTLIDIFVPGFAEFITMLEEKIKNWKNKINDLKKLLQNKLNKKQELEENKNLLQTRLSLLDGDVDNAKTNIDIQKQVLLTKNEQLKDIINIGDVDSTQLNNIQIELEKNCNLVEEYDNILNEYNNINSNNSNDGIINELADLLSKNSNDIDEVDSDIFKIKNEINDTEEKTNALGDICSWGENYNFLILKILRGLGDDIKNQKNPFEEDINEKNRKINELENSIKKLEAQRNYINGKINGEDISSPEQVRNNLKIKKLSIKISEIEEDICNNNYSQSEIDKLLNEINNNENEISELIVSSDIDISKLQEIENMISVLNNEIDSLKSEIVALGNESKNFMDNINLQLSQLDGVVKWIPTILNIVCSLPKMIVNIFIGIVNGIGHMEYLPTLWDFDYI